MITRPKTTTHFGRFERPHLRHAAGHAEISLAGGQGGFALRDIALRAEPQAGGSIAASGNYAPGAESAGLELRAEELPVSLAQRFLRPKAASGAFSSEGTLQLAPAIAYSGSLRVRGLRLVERESEALGREGRHLADSFWQPQVLLGPHELRQDDGEAALPDGHPHLPGECPGGLERDGRLGGEGRDHPAGQGPGRLQHGAVGPLGGVFLFAVVEHQLGLEDLALRRGQLDAEPHTRNAPGLFRDPTRRCHDVFAVWARQATRGLVSAGPW